MTWVVVTSRAPCGDGKRVCGWTRPQSGATSATGASVGEGFLIRILSVLSDPRSSPSETLSRSWVIISGVMGRQTKPRLGHSFLTRSQKAGVLYSCLALTDFNTGCSKSVTECVMFFLRNVGS